MIYGMSAVGTIVCALCRKQTREKDDMNGALNEVCRVLLRSG